MKDEKKAKDFKLCKREEIVLLCIIIEVSLNQAFVNEYMTTVHN